MKKEARPCCSCNSLRWLSPVKVSWGSVSLVYHMRVWRRRCFCFSIQSWGLPLRSQKMIQLQVENSDTDFFPSINKNQCQCSFPSPYVRMKPLCELRKSYSIFTHLISGGKKGKKKLVLGKRLQESALLIFASLKRHCSAASQAPARQQTLTRYTSDSLERNKIKSVNKIRCSPKWKDYEYTV